VLLRYFLNGSPLALDVGLNRMSVLYHSDTRSHPPLLQRMMDPVLGRASVCHL
jgi:hypothetical protein